MHRSSLVISKNRIAEFCKKHGILKLSFFGSITRNDFSSDSDIDVLVEFEPEKTPSFFHLFDMEEELSRILCRKVDLRTLEDLSSYFRDDVLATAEVQYASSR